jgi:hypothetical protein
MLIMNFKHLNKYKEYFYCFSLVLALLIENGWFLTVFKLLKSFLCVILTF